jgi:hypothetical protein
VENFFETIPSAPSRHAWAKPIFGNVFGKQDACLDVAQQSRQSSLPVQEREIAKILAVMLDQVEGLENRGMGSRPPL